MKKIMRHLNQIASVFGAAAFGLLLLTGCEGGDLYSVDNPDWISQKIDSIENAKGTPEEEVLEGMNEDVYTVGNTDFTSGWWASFSKYYQIPDGEKWNAVFNLNINPNDNTYYKNFALVITNDIDRGGNGYTEYGAFRYDFTNDSVKYNSQWGGHLFFKFSESNLPLSPVDNADANIQKMGGKVTLTVDRTDPSAFSIKITNGVVTKTYKQPYALPNLNPDPANTTIRCFIVPEGSYINFLESNIEPIGGYTSALDKNPLSMELQNVPDEVDMGTTLEDAVANISAVVTFEEGVVKTVPAAELLFTAIPNMNEVGEKTLVVIYNKTFKGENASTPIVASAKFRVVNPIASIKVTQAPANNRYYYYSSVATELATDRSLAFDPTGLEVTATYVDGTTGIVNNGKLNFSRVPAVAGNHEVTITTENGKTATVEVSVAESKCTAVTPYPTTLGPADCSGGWWSEHTDNINVPVGETYAVSLTNYSSMAGNWNNFVVVLRSADNATEYGVLRADNYGWGIGYDACAHEGTQGDWATWLAAMNGAKVKVYITNCGNSTADVQVEMNGTDGALYTQYYLGVNNVNMYDFNFAFTIDGCHLVFE